MDELLIVIIVLITVLYMPAKNREGALFNSLRLLASLATVSLNDSFSSRQEDGHVLPPLRERDASNQRILHPTFLPAVVCLRDR